MTASLRRICGESRHVRELLYLEIEANGLRRTFYVYRKSFEAPAGSFSRLHAIFERALEQLAKNVKGEATNNKRKRGDVLRNTIVVKLRGVSTEKALGSRPYAGRGKAAEQAGDEEGDGEGDEDGEGDKDGEGDEEGGESSHEVGVDNQLMITVVGEDGKEVSRLEVSVPLVKLEMGLDRQLKVYLRDPFAPEGKGIIAKRESMVIARDGSCSGTERARSLIPFFSAWNREPTHVSKTLGNLLCYCIFCGQPMKKDTRYAFDRLLGSGDLI